MDAGLDFETLQEICKGLTDSVSIQKLDLRNNIFDEKCINLLLNTLKEHMSIRSLLLENLKFDKNYPNNLAEFIE